MPSLRAKRKYMLLLGADSFILENNLIQKGKNCGGTELEATKDVSFVDNGGKSAKCIQTPEQLRICRQMGCVQDDLYHRGINKALVFP